MDNGTDLRRGPRFRQGIARSQGFLNKTSFFSKPRQRRERICDTALTYTRGGVNACAVRHPEPSELICYLLPPPAPTHMDGDYTPGGPTHGQEPYDGMDPDGGRVL